MAIFKCFGLEIRTGKDQSHFQPQHPPRVPEPISYEKEQEKLALSLNAADNHLSGQGIVPSNEDEERNDPKHRYLALFGVKQVSKALTGVKIAQPRVTLRMKLAKEMIYPSMRNMKNVWEASKYESEVLKAKDMLEGEKHFNICPVNELRDLCGLRHYRHEIYEFLRTKHCTDWSAINDRDVKLIFFALLHVFSDGRIDENGDPIDEPVGTKLAVFDVYDV